MTALIIKLSQFHYVLASMLMRLQGFWGHLVFSFRRLVLRIRHSIAVGRNAVIDTLNAFSDSLIKAISSAFTMMIAVCLRGWTAVHGVRFPQITFPKITFPRFQVPATRWPRFSRFPYLKRPALPTLKKEMFINHRVMNACLMIFLVAGIAGVAKSMPAHYKLFSGIDLAFVTPNGDPSPFYADDFILAQKEPAAGDPLITASADADQSAPPSRYDVGDSTLNVEGVLVPQKTTVISSSRDGKIMSVNFDDGDLFERGDILIAYACEDLKAEMAAVEAENDLSIKKGSRGEKLFKLEIISDFERLDLQNDASKASAQKRILEARMENCEIKAAYDGRVVNRLANDNEYTRTDRVLMEVASLDDLDVEFLLPSKWLRWVNTGAPITLKLFETDREYSARISRIHGEVDPVSQSIQITATLDQYDDPLLPGMSGNILIDVDQIRREGVQGYLELNAPMKKRYE